MPKYRGGAPVQYSIMNGDDKTGVTIIYMVKKMDAGDMLAQAELKIESTDDTGTIFEKMSILGRDVLLETLPKIISGNVEAVKQDENKVVFSPNIKPEEEILHLNLEAKEIDWKTRALRPAPGAYFKNFKGKRTKLWSIKPLEEKTEFAPGYVVNVDKHELKVSAYNGTVYSIIELQPAGKQKMDITSYLNGVGQGLKIGQRIIEDEE